MKPYLLLKPYFKNHLNVLLEGLTKYNLRIDTVFRIDDWRGLSLLIYKKTVEEKGEEWEVGFYGHLELVNYFFGNQALLVTLESNDRQSSIEQTYQTVLKLRKYIRASLRGGPFSGDITVCMNLDKLKLPKSSLLQTRGKLGVSLDRGGFAELIPEAGLWDYYYFKYVHMADTLEEGEEEFETMRKFGVFNKENEISRETFDKMAELRTYNRPEDFN